MKWFLIIWLSVLSLGYGAELDKIDLQGDVSAGYLHIPRDRAIDQSTYLYVKYALEEFRKESVRFVLLDLDTPGGEVFAALRISEELKKMDREYHIPVVAFVDRWAISAGALLAYSCRYIGAVSDASMGAAEPVLMSSEGKMETASEKKVSALRTEFASAAELYGRSPLLAEAMVDKDVTLVMRKGKVIQLLNNDEIITKGEDPDLVINAKGKLLTLNAREMQDWGVSDFTVPEFTNELSSFEVGEKLAGEPFFENVKIHWISYKNWRVDVFTWLSHPLVSSLLMMGLMIGLYGAIQSQGMSFSTLLGVLCLGLILLSAFATEVISWLEVFIVLLGAVLFLGDLFFLTGFGVLGVLGACFFLFGLIMMLLPPLQGFSWDPGDWGIQMSEWIYRLSLFLSVCLIFFFLVLPFGGMLFRKTPQFKRLVLEDPSSTDSKEENSLPAAGKKGTAFSALRPYGKVEIDQQLFEAQTEGEFISQGEEIEVIGFIRTRLIVKRTSFS